MSIKRKTKTVKLILSEFNKTQEAITIGELLKKFDKVMDKTTVYRIIDRLENSNLIHSFNDYDGTKRFAKGKKNIFSNKKNNNHPHFQCEDCGISSCIPIKISIPEIPNYLIKSAEHIFTGQCADCRNEL
ncbi:MAG: transcriptional repressor [Candidatus Neomarinimicrobiota bacterium]|jgi:Fur family ferric uptake transcriptional regulator|nr:transcriptional repressor [Candidatus Neomarinimicrobiota bacterium]